MFCFQHYSYIQSPEIRAKVDELFNCEDIFLNALVADLTMQPGIHTYFTRFTMFPLCERLGRKEQNNKSDQRRVIRGKLHSTISISVASRAARSHPIRSTGTRGDCARGS